MTDDLPGDEPEIPIPIPTAGATPDEPDTVPEGLTTTEIIFVVPASEGDVVVTEVEAEPAPPSAPGPESGREVREAVLSLAVRLDRRLDELQTLFDREIRAEATREKVVDRLHAELQEYKQDLLLKTLRPVFLDLIELHDDIGKVTAGSPDAPDTDDHGPQDVARLLDLMAGFRQGIEDILYRQGVEPFEAEGEPFDPRRQRAVATVATDDPARNKTVAARLRKGFRSGDRVIRPEIVSVYALRKPDG